MPLRMLSGGATAKRWLLVLKSSAVSFRRFTSKPDASNGNGTNALGKWETVASKHRLRRAECGDGEREEDVMHVDERETKPDTSDF